MGDDPSGWAEQGVAVTDSLAAQRRLGESDGLGRQHRWSMNYLDERALGALLMIIGLGGGGLAALSADWRLQALGFAAPFAAVAVLATLFWRRRRRLERLREAQLAEHRRQAGAS